MTRLKYNTVYTVSHLMYQYINDLLLFSTATNDFFITD